MRTAGHVVDKERLLRIYLIEHLHVRYGVIRHGGRQVPARLPDVGVDRRSVSEEIGLPLAGIAADEAVEVLKAHAGRPLVKGPGLTRHESRGVVILAEPGGGIPVLLQDFANRALALLNDRVISRETCSNLGDDAKTHRVMVASGDERGARWGTEGRRMKLRVAQAALCDAVQRGCRDHAAERARRAEADVV